MRNTTFVGLDVHNESITAAILVDGCDEPQVLKLPADLMKVRQLFIRLSDKAPVRACYEASGAGFVLQRSLAKGGFHCDVIAPSLIPRKAGDHRKTDRLDAIMLARLYRSGHLTPVHVPTEEHEALRRLLRLRRSYHAQITSTKHRISGTLRNHGHIFTRTKSAWTKKHFLWLGKLRQTLQGHLQTALSIDLEHLEYLESQVRAIDAELVLNRRRQGQPPAVVAMALKAQHRLHRKFVRLDQRKHRHVAITAVARELCGFVWAILKAMN
jgi:transposase